MKVDTLCQCDKIKILKCHVDKCAKISLFFTFNCGNQSQNDLKDILVNFELSLLKNSTVFKLNTGIFKWFFYSTKKNIIHRRLACFSGSHTIDVKWKINEKTSKSIFSKLGIVYSHLLASNPSITISQNSTLSKCWKFHKFNICILYLDFSLTRWFLQHRVRQSWLYFTCFQHFIDVFETINN